MKRSCLPLGLLTVALLPLSLHASSAPPAGNEKVRKIMETYEGRGTLADSTPPTVPEEAVRSFQTRPGLAVDLMAAEPAVEQPLYMNWDSRGRLWVIQYRQYQFPAGLKVVSYDSHLRAQFDRVPAPPPAGDKGADKVTVFEDTKGSGFFDKHTDVLSGLNIASAALPGAGAIWVLNPPYLLRYPDANGDGLPDGDPEVALSGFGIEDTHSVASSLQWGVDGWLYGANGSTTTGNVSSVSSKNVRWEGQCIWRYHPVSKQFEVYAEGGGNTFSLDIDSKGRVFSGTNGGGTRGMHYEQGSYGIKSWGKHGPLTNQFAFGWFEHMRHEGDGRRFPQAFAIYEGGLLGAAYEGHVIAPNSLANLVYVSDRMPDGSSFRTRDGANLLSSSDRWYRPVDVKVGPDGGVYLADWYDTRLSHVRPVDDWHKTSGRIYRVRPEGAAPKLPSFDLHTAPPEDLLLKLSHPNRWFRRQAALEIGWRHLEQLIPELRRKAVDSSDPHALDAVFAADMLNAVDAALLKQLLSHSDPYVRRWAVKIAGEKWATLSHCAADLQALARSEEHLEVRAQLLASAKRLPAVVALPMLHAALRALPPEETHVQLLAWWTLESKVESDPIALYGFLSTDKLFVESSLFLDHIAKRLGQRLVAAADKGGLEAASELAGQWGEMRAIEPFMEGISDALDALQVAYKIPASLEGALRGYRLRKEGPVVAAFRAGGPLSPALKTLADTKAPLTERIAVANLIAERVAPEAASVCVSLLANNASPTNLKRALLRAAARQGDVSLAGALIGGYESRIAGDKQLREEALRTLAARIDWARALVQAVEDWKIPAKHVTPEIVTLLREHRDPELDAASAKLWKGVLGTFSLEEKTREAMRLRQALRSDGVIQANVSRGRELFQQRCAACHKLFGEGNAVGPELTGYERGSVDFWIDNIVYPSLEIREGYANYVARLKDGRILSGMLDSQSGAVVVLRDLSGQKTTVRQAELESLAASPVSIMPEGLLAGLSAEEVRHLFAFLTQPNP